jgi:hypothetical protein
MVDVLREINKHPAAEIQDLLPHNWRQLQEVAPLL